MTKYPCNSISLEYAVFNDVVDSFIGQKVIINCLDKEIIGQVESCDLQQAKVRLFGNVNRFVVSKTTGNFMEGFVEIPLSPSILGRQLDFFGNSVDDLPPIIPVSKTVSFYTKLEVNIANKSQIVSDKDWLIVSEDFKIQKGDVKSHKDFSTLLPLLSISNIALLVVEMDYQSKKFKNLQQLLVDNNLDQISIFFQSQSQNDIALAPSCISQVANYLASHLGFDVLIVVAHSEQLKNTNINEFYFARNIEQLASIDANNSITIINL